MIYISISRKNHSRAPEWFSAVFMFGFGLTLLHPSRTFDSSSYRAFDQSIGESGTGIITFAVAAFWLFGLWYNGRKETLTSTVRACCACMGVVVYAMLTTGFVISFFLTGLLSTGWWAYFMMSMLSLYNVTQILHDKGACRNGATNRS
ncbi:hypothetical protein N7I30_14060 [Aurantimonas litoralis]|nr:hypothetical protein [Aurantimonas litoralis]